MQNGCRLRITAYNQTIMVNDTFDVALPPRLYGCLGWTWLTADFCNSSAVSTGKYQWLKVVAEHVTIWKA